MARRLIAASTLLLLSGGGVLASDVRTRALHRTLVRLESRAPAPDGDASEGVRERRSADRAELRELLRDFRRRDRTRRAEFARAARQPLPPAARERLEAARAAYEAGQGRLLEILRPLAEDDEPGVGAQGAGSRPRGRSEDIGVALDIVRRLERAARRRPLSAELKIRAPELQPPPLVPEAALSQAEAQLLADPPSDPIGYVPQLLRDHAATLGDPIAVYEWVRNATAPEFYHGAMKGALGAFREGSANDADTAALLIALLRAQGVPARFVRGTVDVSAATAAALVGTATVEQALRVLARSGVPHIVVPGAGGVTVVRMERVWVEAYLPYVNYRGVAFDQQGKVWIPLDAAFKPLSPPRGIDVLELGFDPRTTFDEYLEGSRDETPREYLRAQIGAFVASARPGATLDDVGNVREVPAESLGLLPSSLPYRVVSLVEVGAEVPEAMRHRLRFVAETPETRLLDASFTVADLLGSRLTLSYVPATPEDQEVADLYGGMLATPPYLIEVKPVLKKNGLVLAAGDGGVGLGVRYDLRIALTTPGGTETVSNRVLAGNLTAIGLGGADVQTPEEDLEEAAKILSGLAFHYLDGWNDSDAELADLFHVVPLRPTVSVCFVLSDMEVEYAGGDPLYPLTFDWKGIAVDADLRASSPVAVANRDAERAFTLLSGLEGSILENRLFEDRLEIPSVSTAKALQLAPGQSIEVLDLTAANAEPILLGLPIDEDVKEEILEATAQGWLARVPAADVGYLAWTGVGYLLLDEETGEAAYQLQGGHSGGVTAPAVVDLPSELVDALEKASETPAPSGTPVAYIQKFGSTDYQFGTVNEDLTHPLKVLVTDEDGFPVPGAPVTFTVLGGGGRFLDPATGRPAGAQIQVLSCTGEESAGPCETLKPGEATVRLRLGERTDEIPRYFCAEGHTCTCPEGETCDPDTLQYPTQVGMHLVTATSGAAILSEPFSAFAEPDTQFDGTHIRVTLGLKAPPANPPVRNLSVADRLAVSVSDPYGNPISNAHILFEYRRDPEPSPPPPGWSRARPMTTTPGHLIAPRDYTACLESAPSVFWGDCPGEAESLVLTSSPSGVYVYPVLGDSPYSRYFFDFGTTVTPAANWVRYHTMGPLCATPDPAECSPAALAPFTRVSHGTRPVRVNGPGNLIEAYSPGETATLGLWADVLYEGVRIETFREPGDEEDRYRAVGTNAWHRERLEDSEFPLSSLTPGTQVAPVAVHVGEGRYQAPMTMATTPQLNTVEWEGRSFPMEILYRDASEAEVDPSTVDPVTLEVTKRRAPYGPWANVSDFSLWGVEPAITGIDPAPVLLDPASLVLRPSVIRYEIQPPEYGTLLSPTQVLFEIEDVGDPAQPRPVLAAHGTGEDFVIPPGLSLPPSRYEADLTVLGTSTDPGQIVSSAYLVPACQPLDLQTRTVSLAVTLDPLNQTQCGSPGLIRFTLCRDAQVTLTLDGQVLRAPIDGDTNETLLRDVLLSAGAHSVQIAPDSVSPTLDDPTPFRIETVDAEDPSIVAADVGRITNVLRNRAVLPVGRTFVKGIDLFDGHVVHQTTDIQVPGRHLGIDLTRTYSSAGKSDEGVVGAGWALSYASRLTPTECGVVAVTTADGSTQAFQPGADGGFEPQKGYHTRLVENLDGSFDFFDKAGNRHHFREPEIDTPEWPNLARRLEYIEEPHGDRIGLTYDGRGNVVKVAEVHPGPVEQRALEMRYEPVAGFDRVVEAAMPALALTVTYEYDRYGNLVKATRGGANLAGPATADRVESYEYSVDDPLDRHQLRAVIGPNDGIGDRRHRREYVYYDREDPFPGESSGLVVTGKEEYAREVKESPEGVITTGFQYDLSGADTEQEWRTTVRDPRGHDTLYVLNSNGSPLRVEEPLARVTRMDWATDDIYKTREVDANGRVTEYEYDDNGNLALERVLTDDLGAVVTDYRYDLTFNKLEYKKDPEGRETRWTINDTTGDLLDTTDAVGDRTEYRYDGNGQLTASINPRGHTTSFSNHDTFGNPRTVEEPLGHVVTRTYDLRGRLEQQSDTEGRVTRNTWDGLDRLTSVVREAGGSSDDEETITSYYPGGEVRSVRNASGAVTEYTLDGLNRVIGTATTFPGASYTTQTQYDANGNRERETDRRGVVRRNTFDALNRLTTAEILSGPDPAPVGVIAEYTYDKVGNRLSETNLAGLTTTFTYDGLYRVEEKVLPEGNPAYREQYGYDRVGNRTSFVDANGHETRFAYDGLNRLTRTTNALEQDTIVLYEDEPGNPDTSHVNKSEEYDPVRGLRRRFAYDERNRLSREEVTLEGVGSSGESYVRTTRYEESDHSMTVTDARGVETYTRLDGRDRIVEQTVDPGDLALNTRMSYDGLGNRKELIDPEGHRTTWLHDGLGRLVETTDAALSTATSIWDGEGLKTSETDRRGVRRDFTYDNVGRLRRTELQPDPALSGVAWSQETEYRDRERQRVDTDARGHATTSDLDGLDRVVAVVDPRGERMSATRDGVNKRSETDKRGHTTGYDYDELDRLVRVTDPEPFDSQTVETLYEDALNRRTDTDRRGFARVTEMDPLGRVIRVTDAGVVVERNTWDPNGNRLTQTDAEDRTTRFTYDAANRVDSRTDGDGTPEAATTTFEYDRNGNQTIERDARAAALGEPFSRSSDYDELNRLVSVEDGEGHATDYEYDEEGNRTLARKPEGQETRFGYDELGALRRVTQPGDLATTYDYDENRNRVRQTDANGHVVEMEYDELDRLTSMTQDPGGLGLATRHDYDENGNETRLTDAKSQIVESTYDELNRLRNRTFTVAPGDPTRLWRYTTGITYDYDENDNPTEVRESTASGLDPPEPGSTLTTTRQYDDLDRLLSETTSLPDGGQRTVAYSYWANGLRRSVTDPAGRVTDYTYDGQNRLQTATTDFGTAEAATTSYTYFPDDLLETVSYPNGAVATHGYDRADRLTSLQNASGGTVFSSFTYTYDGNGNRLSQVETNGLPTPTTETTGYTYDDLNRLETVTYPTDAAYPLGRVVTYGYDDVGNRTRETETDSDGTVLADRQGIFDNANRLTALEDLLTPADSVAFTWDANGNQSTKTQGGVTTTYLYDVRDKLVEVQQDASILGRFQYDFEGRRSKKIGEEGLRQYVYDQTSLLAEYDDAGLEKAKYDYGSDRLIALTRADEGRRYFSLDGLRSVVSLTDDTGSAVAAYHLDAWGNFRFPSELDASRNRFAFTGHIYDSETGLYNAKARYFDPKLGRFLTQDSFLGNHDNPPSLHRYLYGYANPLRYVDPTGHQSLGAAAQAERERRAQREGSEGPTYTTGQGGNIVVSDPTVRVSRPTPDLRLAELTPEQMELVRREAARIREERAYRDQNAPKVAAEANPSDDSSLLARAAQVLGYLPNKGQELTQEYGTAVLKDAFGVDRPAPADPHKAANQLAAEQSGYTEEAGHLVNPYSEAPESLAEHGGYGAGIGVRAGVEYAQARALEKGIGAVADEFASLRGGGRLYGDLDDLGRPTGVRARLTRESIVGGTRARSELRPPGFRGGVQGHARGHLLGKQLGGSGTDPRNLVTLHQNPTNMPLMRGFENQVRRAVDAGEAVNYRVTPIYRGSDPMPVGITMEAHGDRGLELFVTIRNIP